jgi:excisionase family DNA binding protein
VTELRISIPEKLIEEIVRRVLAELQPAPEPSPWYSVKDAADYLGVSASLMKSAIRRGALRSRKVDGRRLLHRDDVDAFARGDGSLQSDLAAPAAQERPGAWHRKE